MTQSPITNISAAKTVKKFDVRVSFTMRGVVGYEVLAETEESARNIALFRLGEDRKDYAGLENITAEIKAPK